MSQSIENEAEAAQALLSNPLLLAVLAELDSDAVRTWRAGSNAEQREQAWHQMMAVQRLGARLKSRLESKLLADRRQHR